MRHFEGMDARNNLQVLRDFSKENRHKDIGKWFTVQSSSAS